MEKYLNKSGDSPISGYTIHPDSIDITYEDNPTIYRYTALAIGSTHLTIMKRLARNGKGLSTYINQNAEVKNGAKPR